MNIRTVLLVCFATVTIGIFSTSCHSSHKAGSQSNRVHGEESLSIKNINATESQKQIVKEALSWVDTPYAYAKCDKKKGTDCSGMVLRVYEDVTGKKLPHGNHQF